VTIPDRDASIDRLLSRSAKTAGIPDASPQCLDADTLAAWVEGSLPAPEAAAAEAHASSCARCQATAAALVRVLPEVAIPQPWWRRRWVMAGLVPVTAGAMALAFWVKSPEPNQMKTAPEETQSAAVPLEARREPPAASEMSPRPSPAAAPPPAARDRADAPRALGKDAVSQDRFALRDQDRQAEALQKKSEAKTDALVAAPPPVTGQPGGLNESAARSQVQPNAVELASPDAANRWRIGAAGSIQRSIDRGATWETLRSGATQDLLAGVAVSPTVCWVIGRGGTVLLSTDGRTWRLVPLPEPVDLVAIEARDALSADVTTADRRTFRTTDGGRTWSAVQEI
jgi:hypothetical protein